MTGESPSNQRQSQGLDWVFPPSSFGNPAVIDAKMSETRSENMGRSQVEKSSQSQAFKQGIPHTQLPTSDSNRAATDANREEEMNFNFGTSVESEISPSLFSTPGAKSGGNSASRSQANNFLESLSKQSPNLRESETEAQQNEDGHETEEQPVPSQNPLRNADPVLEESDQEEKATRLSKNKASQTNSQSVLPQNFASPETLEDKEALTRAIELLGDYYDRKSAVVKKPAPLKGFIKTNVPNARFKGSPIQSKQNNFNAAQKHNSANSSTIGPSPLSGQQNKSPPQIFKPVQEKPLQGSKAQGTREKIVWNPPKQDTEAENRESKEHASQMQEGPPMPPNFRPDSPPLPPNFPHSQDKASHFGFGSPIASGSQGSGSQGTSQADKAESLPMLHPGETSQSISSGLIKS